MMTYSCLKMPFPITAREFLNRWIYVVQDKDSYAIASVPISDEEVGQDFQLSHLENVVRAKNHTYIKIERYKHNQSIVTHVTENELKGSALQKVVTSLTISQTDLVQQLYNTFQCDNKVDEIERNLFIR